MPDLIKSYTALHRQGFVPIFVRDELDAVMLTEAAVEAGAVAVEITCRRPDVVEEIRRIRKQFPDILVMVGSIVDDGPMLEHLKRRRPDMPSIDELIGLGVHGFVSFMPISIDTIARVSETHLIAPGVETMREGVAAAEAGAQFVKYFSTAALGGPDRVALLNSAATFGLLPTFITGGVTLERVGAFIEAGASLLGSGWDLILSNDYAAQREHPDPKALADRLRAFIEATQKARCNMASQFVLEAEDADYLRLLPHWHPFAPGV